MPVSISIPVTFPTRFILLHTSHAGNVGAAARAMKTMGFDDLVLVAPRWPDVLQQPETIQRASGAHDVLERARIVTTLDEALQHMDQAPPVQALLVDYHLHDRADGLDALDALCAQYHAAGALITADGSDTLKAQADARGYPVLTKPLKPAALRAFLMAHWRNSVQV